MCGGARWFWYLLHSLLLTMFGVTAVSMNRCIDFLIFLKPLLGSSASCSSWGREPTFSSTLPVLCWLTRWMQVGEVRRGAPAYEGWVRDQWLYSCDFLNVPSTDTVSQLPSPYISIVAKASNPLVHTAGGSQIIQGRTQSKHAIVSYWLIDWCSPPAFPRGAIRAALGRKDSCHPTGTA